MSPTPPSGPETLRARRNSAFAGLRNGAGARPSRGTRPWPWAVCLVLASLFWGNGSWARDRPRAVIFATTTSVQDTGLLDDLLPAFTRRTGIPVKPVVVGSGEALALAARGEADLLLAHAPEAEQAFMEAGHGRRRRPFAHNDFVLVGPPKDPAGLRRQGRPGSSAAEALRQLAQGGHPFVSRGDQSGTHKRELALWKTTGITPAGDWYLSVGDGQAATLMVASQRTAYSLSDRGTHLATQKRTGLVVMVEGDPQLINRYSVIEIDPKRHPKINHAGGAALAEYLLSSEVQLRLKSFGVDRYGRPLFVPDALPAEPPSP